MEIPNPVLAATAFSILVPPQVVTHLGVDNSELDNFSPEDLGKIKEIYEWAGEDLEDKSLGNLLMKLRDLDVKLGATPIGERRWKRIWNYVHLDKRVKDMEKQRNACLRS